jgi:RNA 3'-phosphate cyclase
MNFIEIDGSEGEGGGQIIRTAVALSAVTGKPVRIKNVRAGRPNPGLQSQHVHSIKAVAKLCSARLVGVERESQTFEFHPGKIQAGKVEIDVGTAGSCYLVLQSIIPAALHAEKFVELSIKGGTDVKWAPTSPAMEDFVWFLEKFGVKVELNVKKYGFYPKGGGLVEAKIHPGQPKPFQLIERGDLKGYSIHNITTKDLKVAKVMEHSVEAAKKLLPETEINARYVASDSSGVSFHTHAKFENTKFGEDLLGEKGIRSEVLGKQCAELLQHNLARGGCLDRHMADQVMIYAALAAPQGESRYTASEITEHCRTNARIIEKFLPVKFKIDEKKRSVLCKAI